jgi:hypothetical protein
LPNLSKYDNIRELMKIHLSSIREINENFRWYFNLSLIFEKICYIRK